MKTIEDEQTVEVLRETDDIPQDFQVPKKHRTKVQHCNTNFMVRASRFNFGQWKFAIKKQANLYCLEHKIECDKGWIFVNIHIDVSGPHNKVKQFHNWLEKVIEAQG